jgi:hypothetical protein
MPKHPAGKRSKTGGVTEELPAIPWLKSAADYFGSIEPA